ncbi:hypothetical protein CL630_02040 [bacterium]|jgi:hypothetical protein|nr:hypothetical protein [bacterium]|tara:strand:- start:4833 stop:5093 length:261 start_codon:yes stop_codon:yes gene_type:complete
MRRIFLNFLLFFSVLFFPWLVTIALGIAAVFLVRKFYEIIGWGVLYDLLYSTSDINLFGFHFFSTAGAIIIFYVAEFLKSKTRLSM